VIDTLSDVLRHVRLTGAVFFTIHATEPWVADSAPARLIAPHISGGVEHVIPYHVLFEGTGWGGLIGEPAIRLEAGDIIVFPHGDPHVISSAPGMRGGPSADAYDMKGQLPVAMSIEGGGPSRAQITCGFLGCDARPFNPLLSNLPRVLHARGSGESGSVLRSLCELALAESKEPSAGGHCMLSRLSELLFVEVVRRHLSTMPPEKVGWLSGLRDEHVGRALQTLHHRPAHPWTLEELARGVGVSRSLLAERFAHLVGIPPMQYLAEWRVQLAASLLRTTTASLAEIADSVGYGSETALSRAFKRCVGVAPALYRRGTPPSPASPAVADPSTS
jgi:AraC-like DNA-binding protein